MSQPKKVYLIPKLPNEGCKNTIQPGTRTYQEILQSIKDAYFESSYVFEDNWTISSVDQVINQDFEKLYQDKRQELRSELKSSDVGERFAFAIVGSEEKANDACKNGVFSGHEMLTSMTLGKRTDGVHVWLYSDIPLKWATKNILKAYLIVYKVMRGRAKLVKPTVNSNIDPTPNFECHVSHVTKTANFGKLVNSSQMFIYEYDDEALPSKHPRHCYPYAVVKCTRIHNDALPWSKKKVASEEGKSKLVRLMEVDTLPPTKVVRSKSKKKVTFKESVNTLPLKKVSGPKGKKKVVLKEEKCTSILKKESVIKESVTGETVTGESVTEESVTEQPNKLVSFIVLDEYHCENCNSNQTSDEEETNSTNQIKSDSKKTENCQLKRNINERGKKKAYAGKLVRRKKRDRWRKNYKKIGRSFINAQPKKDSDFGLAAEYSKLCNEKLLQNTKKQAVKEKMLPSPTEVKNEPVVHTGINGFNRTNELIIQNGSSNNSKIQHVFEYNHSGIAHPVSSNVDYTSNNQLKTESPQDVLPGSAGVNHQNCNTFSQSIPTLVIPASPPNQISDLEDKTVPLNQSFDSNQNAMRPAVSYKNGAYSPSQSILDYSVQGDNQSFDSNQNVMRPAVSFQNGAYSPSQSILDYSIQEDNREVMDMDVSSPEPNVPIRRADTFLQNSVSNTAGCINKCFKDTIAEYNVYEDENKQLHVSPVKKTKKINNFHGKTFLTKEDHFEIPVETPNGYTKPPDPRQMLYRPQKVSDLIVLQWSSKVCNNEVPNVSEKKTNFDCPDKRKEVKTSDVSPNLQSNTSCVKLEYGQVSVIKHTALQTMLTMNQEILKKSDKNHQTCIEKKNVLASTQMNGHLQLSTTFTDVVRKQEGLQGHDPKLKNKQIEASTQTDNSQNDYLQTKFIYKDDLLRIIVNLEESTISANFLFELFERNGIVCSSTNMMSNLLENDQNMKERRKTNELKENEDSVDYNLLSTVSHDNDPCQTTQSEVNYKCEDVANKKEIITEEDHQNDDAACFHIPTTVTKCSNPSIQIDVAKTIDHCPAIITTRNEDPVQNLCKGEVSYLDAGSEVNSLAMDTDLSINNANQKDRMDKNPFKRFPEDLQGVNPNLIEHPHEEEHFGKRRRGRGKRRHSSKDGGVINKDDLRHQINEGRKHRLSGDSSKSPAKSSNISSDKTDTDTLHNVVKRFRRESSSYMCNNNEHLQNHSRIGTKSYEDYRHRDPFENQTWHHQNKYDDRWVERWPPRYLNGTYVQYEDYWKWYHYYSQWP
ncbi:uncharacterized protein [Antedon mediterranea]|uniref:uncharacterized protein isoform X1 n=1 Tax=Antedon mediterranea TaxID=105859 RepID=UPI003AF66713